MCAQRTRGERPQRRGYLSTSRLGAHPRSEVSLNTFNRFLRGLTATYPVMAAERHDPREWVGCSLCNKWRRLPSIEEGEKAGKDDNWYAALHARAAPSFGPILNRCDAQIGAPPSSVLGLLLTYLSFASPGAAR